MKIRFKIIKKFNAILFILLVFAIPCQTYAQSKKAKNILFIIVDDLRPELKSFGVPYIVSPNIDHLATTGRLFTNQYVAAPSCGPSRCAMLTGCYGPYSNETLFQRAKAIKNNWKKINPTMPEWFRNKGYTTVSVGKVSHHPGGWGGEDWNDSTILEMPNAWTRSLMPVGDWQHPRGAMHGLANGEIRNLPANMDVFQSTDGPDTIYPDGLIVEEGMNQLSKLAVDKKKPFFLVVGVLKPHLPFGAPKKYLDMYNDVILPPISAPNKPDGISTWFNSNEFMLYNRWGNDPRTDADFADATRRHYAACVSYADEQVGRILQQLKATGADKNTIVVLWGDHGWNLGEHGIWGKHNLFNVALRAPLIIRYPDMKKPGVSANGVVESIDIFPTLCDLAQIEKPDFISGTSLLPLLKNPKNEGRSAISYTDLASTIKTKEYRLIVHKNGGIELYNHLVDPNECTNTATRQPEMVAKLKKILADKLVSKLSFN